MDLLASVIAPIGSYPQATPQPPMPPWWAGYWAGFWVCFWIMTTVLVVAVLAFWAGRNWQLPVLFKRRPPKWWEHMNDKPSTPPPGIKLG